MLIGRDTKTLTITVGNALLEQVLKYSYLGHMITEDVATLKEVQIRIEQIRQKFWENKELLRSNVGLNTKKRILACYVLSVFNYGCEAWTNPRRFKTRYRRSKCGASGDFSTSHRQKRKTIKKLYKWPMSAKERCNNL
ncbi:endonuclease-reverse transcriptase [Elysia marginata]|uniref:Endonuclease-reverse transcriptase n=1 Tax=Elysia marginata TaxID=1093978 RepID=A0AAV4EWN5_9GAST|nr:endonuclease-reverse transcriptase [Elysia marginata]